MEEVIEREDNSRDVVESSVQVASRKSQDQILDTKYYILETANRKSIPCRAKAAQVEESKKGYTGDALALRGDERRDKLR